MERISPLAYGNDPANWAVTTVFGGTPGWGPDTTPPVVLSIDINAHLTDPPDLPVGPQPTSWEQQRSEIAGRTGPHKVVVL